MYFQHLYCLHNKAVTNDLVMGEYNVADTTCLSQTGRTACPGFCTVLLIASVVTYFTNSVLLLGLH